MTSILSNMTNIVASYLSDKHSCCSIHENAGVPEGISQYTVERSLIFFIREGQVEGTSKDSQLFVRDRKFVIPCLKKIKGKLLRWKKPCRPYSTVIKLFIQLLILEMEQWQSVFKGKLDIYSYAYKFTGKNGFTSNLLKGDVTLKKKKIDEE